MLGQWDVMLHGAANAQFDRQSGPRGGTQVGSINWGMVMASRPLSGGTLTLRGMFSLDVLGVTPRGYPLLLQSGETYRGLPLHDRQHPHDALMETAVMFSHPLAGPFGLELYAAPVGEPALGPPAFMHRPSAMDNPAAPIGHHWQDATHISYGVVTAGLTGSRWKLEGSAFNGREPDANRWNVDPIRLDSYAGRASYAPSDRWTASASYGYLASPEALHPEDSEHRITAALLYGRELPRGGFWATTAVWGANAHATTPGLAHSVLIESERTLGANAVFARAEFVQKSADELAVDPARIGVPADHLFPVSAWSLGYVREVHQWAALSAGLGTMATLNVVPANLAGAYGSRTPAGLFVFLRIRPSSAATAPMMMMHDMGSTQALHPEP